MVQKKTTKKVKKQKPTEKELEKKIVELANKGLTAEKIGETLKKEGIHIKEYNKKILRILKEKGNYVNPDIKNLENKLEKIQEHCKSNKQDKRSIREKDRIFAKLRRLKKYFKK